MTIYDELGLTPDATDDQIRQAHRQLAKLLHPDLQRDPELRRIAELQLMRVNRMVEQLLAASRVPVAPVELVRIADDCASVSALHRSYKKRERVWKYLTSVACLVAVAVLLVLLLPEPAIRSQAPAPRDGLKMAAAEHPPRQSAPQVSPGPASAPRRVRNADKPGEAPSGEPEEAVPVAVAVSVAVPEAAPVLAPRVEVPPIPFDAKPPEPKPDLNGVWLYAGDPGPGAPAKLYAPEYIELRLGQDPDGTLHGEYRGRFAVTDMAISPSVSFRFREKNPNLSALPWSSPRGSAGTVSLELVRNDVLQVTWKAMTTASNAAGGAELTFGAATLIRRR